MNKKRLITAAAISVAALVLIAATLIVSIAVFASGEIPYSDVKKGTWYYGIVKDAYEKALMNGRSETEFAPDGTMTRAEVVTVLSRLSGDDVSAKSGSAGIFSDVSKGEWYENYIGWAADAGIVKGYPDGSFKPDGPVSRAEFAAMACRFVEYIEFELPSDSSLPRFSDENEIPAWAKEYIELLRLSGILEGDAEKRATASSRLTRAETAAIAIRIAKLLDADPMYAAAVSLSDRLITKNEKIYLTLGKPDSITSETFTKLILRNQLGFDIKKYRVELDDQELSDLRFSYGALRSGESMETKLTVSIYNAETNEKTDKRTESFLLSRDDEFDPDMEPVYEYKLLLDGSCEIVGWRNPAGWTKATIPSELNGIPVAAIGDEAFAERRELREIIILEGVSKIGKQAFSLCTSLKRAVIPDSVTEIGRGAFYYCRSLTNVNLPASLERIPDYMFYMCSSLKRAALPERTVEIGTSAFNHTAVSNISFHDGIEKIGDYAFEETGITSAVMPESCRYVGSWAFYNCRGVKRAYLNKELDFIGSGVFYGCDELPEVNYGGSESDWERFKLRGPVLDHKTINFEVEEP